MPDDSTQATVEANGAASFLQECAGSLAGLRVLVISASRNERCLIAQLLRHLEASADVAKDLDGCAWDAPIPPYDAIVIDTSCGEEALSIAARAAPNAVRVALTANSSKENTRRLQAAGADHIVETPLMDGGDLARVLLRTANDRCPSLQAREAAATPPQCSGPLAAKLAELLEIAGPEHRRDLLEELESDLARTRRDLHAAGAAFDAPGMRAATHVLIGLAGTLGDTSLHLQAKAANRAAHRGDHREMAAHAAEITAGTDALLHEVRQHMQAAAGRTPS